MSDEATGQTPATPPATPPAPAAGTPALTPPATPPAPVTPPAPSGADMLAHPDVVAEIRRQNAATEARIRAEEADKATKAAERAKMEEADRLRAEKTDAETASAAAAVATKDAERSRDIYKGLAITEQRLVDENAMEYVKGLVEARVKGGETIDAAVKKVFETHPYLVKPATAPAAAATATSAATGGGTATGATVAGAATGEGTPATPPAGAPPKVTSVPAADTPKPPVDVMKMTPQEYRQYKRDTYGYQG